jgi:hypothetical protein
VSINGELGGRIFNEDLGALVAANTQAHQRKYKLESEVDPMHRSFSIFSPNDQGELVIFFLHSLTHEMMSSHLNNI